MYTFLVSLLLLDALILVTAILLQSGKGGGMAASFGGASTSSDQLFGTRQAGNLLTKLSWWCGGIFITLAYILQLSASRGRVPTSVLDKSFAAPTQAAPAPTTAPAGAAGANATPLPLTPAGDAKAAAPATKTPDATKKP